MPEPTQPGVKDFTLDDFTEVIEGQWRAAMSIASDGIPGSGQPSLKLEPSVLMGLHAAKPIWIAHNRKMYQALKCRNMIDWMMTAEALGSATEKSSLAELAACKTKDEMVAVIQSRMWTLVGMEIPTETEAAAIAFVGLTLMDPAVHLLHHHMSNLFHEAPEAKNK
jgi:hypothetical protein